MSFPQDLDRILALGLSAAALMYGVPVIFGLIFNHKQTCKDWNRPGYVLFFQALMLTIAGVIGVLIALEGR